MNCALCNGKYIKEKGQVDFISRALGKVHVPNLTYLKCSLCGNKLLSVKESEKATNFLMQVEQRRIERLPVSDFVSARQAAEILGISKQAFSKHPKIRNGLIYSVTIGKRNFYHKKSVGLFKIAGNGKFSLSPKARQVIPQKLFIRINDKSKNYNEHEIHYRRPSHYPRYSSWAKGSDILNQWSNLTK